MQLIWYLLENNIMPLSSSLNVLFQCLNIFSSHQVNTKQPKGGNIPTMAFKTISVLVLSESDDNVSSYQQLGLLSDRKRS